MDHQGYEAVLTVEASDEPYGILNFASSSRTVLIQEENKTIQLFINREFGSLGLYIEECRLQNIFFYMQLHYYYFLTLDVSQYYVIKAEENASVSK